MIFDYETIRIIWWGVLGLFLIGFAIACGLDLGVALLLSLVGKNDDERSIIINTVGPVWLGNQVALVLVISALFSAWPLVYAVTFSSLYFVLLFALFTFILRPLCFFYRNELTHLKWREILDKVIIIGALLATLFFGIGFGNLFIGIPFHLENDLKITYLGSIWGLLNPFGILIGLLSLSLFVMQGAIYLQMKTEGVLNHRAKTIVLRYTILTLTLFALAGFFVSFMDGYHISSLVLTDGSSNPLLKTVKREPGLWLDNYGHYPKLWIIPFTTFISAYTALVFSRANRPGSAFLFGMVTVSTMLITAGCTLFPFLNPSSISLNSSLTVWDSSSSLQTLTIMLWGMIVFLPLIFAYLYWMFKILHRKTTIKKVPDTPSFY